MKRKGFSVMARLIRLVRPLSGYMALAIILGVLGHLFAASVTVLGSAAFAGVLGARSLPSVKVLLVCLAVFSLLRGPLRYGEQACNHFIAFKLLALIRDRVFAALRRLCPAKLEGRERGNLISLITSDIELLEVFYAHTISPVVIAVLFGIAMLGLLFSIHPLFSLIALLFYLAVGAGLPMATARLGSENALSFRNASGRLGAFMLDSLRGLDETIQFGGGARRLDAIKAESDALSQLEKRMKLNAGMNAAAAEGLILAGTLSGLAAGLWLLGRGSVSFAGMLIAVTAIFSSFGPFLALGSLGSTLQNTLAAGNRVLDILDEEPIARDITGMPPVEFHGAEARNIDFKYENEEIFKAFSLTVPENKIIGISGRSGSGKSTLLRLMMRFWPVDGGSVTVSGTDVERINTDNLREMESYVTQDTHLFRGTIMENLRIARLDAAEKEVHAACKKAAVHDFILSLPRGYDTEVGETGDTLSGGERQRLGLARAFLSGAPMMLLDEPTSNLDSLNEAVILKSLNEERGGRTVVLVSHRPSTMRVADTVYSVENGRLS